MKSIYASKLYIASSRKDRIHAALLAPSNLELVQQLAEDLDDTYQTPENLGQTEEKKEEEGSESEGFDDFIVDEDIDPEKDLVTMKDFESISKGSSSHSVPSHSAGPSKAPKSEDSGSESKEPKGESKVDTSDLMPDSPATEEKPKPAEANTKVNDSAKDISATTIVRPEKLIDINTVKNTLNNREDTAGVERIAEKENELWIYYNDDINLNNIMSEVIELLLTEGYEMFEFNRLARSDNAIVFVKTISTQANPKSIESENDNK